VQRAECWVLGVGCWVLCVECWVLGVGCSRLGVGCRSSLEVLVESVEDAVEPRLAHPLLVCHLRKFI